MITMSYVKCKRVIILIHIKIHAMYCEHEYSTTFDIMYRAQ